MGKIERDQRYYERHKMAKLAANKAYYEANRDEINRKKTEWQRKYRVARRSELNKRDRGRYASDVEYRLTCRLRHRLRAALHGGFKAGSAVRDLGCTIAELKDYLERLFQPGMSWANHGEWHIDHIRPLAKFDLTDRAQLLQACHYTNLQPLWATENMMKGAHG